MKYWLVNVTKMIDSKKKLSYKELINAVNKLEKLVPKCVKCKRLKVMVCVSHPLYSGFAYVCPKHRELLWEEIEKRSKVGQEINDMVKKELSK